MSMEDACAWLSLCADDYSATVCMSTLRRHPESLLCGLADTALATGRRELRLDMDAAVAREVVSCLRLGPRGYVPPDNPRLRAALQHSLDYLGIPLPPGLPMARPESEPLLFVHSYLCGEVDDSGRDLGLLLYSERGGWAALGCGGASDPRPPGMDPEWFYAAATLPREDTGQDFDAMLVCGPDSTPSYLMRASDRHVLPVPSPRGVAGPCVAVRGRGFLLGRHSAAAVACFDPVLSCWFESCQVSVNSYDFAAATLPCGDAILVAGGVDSSSGRHRDAVQVFDTRARAWTSTSADPAMARMPCPSRGMAVAPLDGNRMLLFGGSAGPEAHVLDLRTWRFQPAGSLVQRRQHLCGVSLSSGTVLALGGVGDHDEYVDTVEAYSAAANAWSVRERLPCAMAHLAATTARVC